MDGVRVLIAVKALAAAKTRLAPPFEPRERAALVLAMLADTVTAALAADRVRSVHVISPDPRVLQYAADTGARAVPDPTATLNDALRHGAAVLGPSAAVAVLQGDLPALRPQDLDAALAWTGRVAVADRGGTGTTLLVAPAATPVDPRFGPGSAAAHARSGARLVTGPWPGLRTDVDTAEDLAVALALGVGGRSAAHLARGGAVAWTPPAPSGTIAG